MNVCPYCGSQVAEDPTALNGISPTKGEGCEFCNPDPVPVITTPEGD